MNSRQAYRHLVARHADAGPSTLRGFSNHLPMALAALCLDGASAADLERFAGNYALDLKPSRPVAVDIPASREQALAGAGHPERFWEIRDHIESEIGRRGSDAVLREWLPDLLPALATGAFHGLIRTAYAARMGEPGEIAAGLAAWAAGFHVVTAPSGTPLPLEKQIAAMDADPALRDFQWARPPVMGRLREAAAHPAFLALLAPLPSQPFDVAVQGMADAAIAFYADTLDFTALHLVTACHAIGMLRPHLARPDAVPAMLWPAYAAAWVAARSSARASERRSVRPDPASFDGSLDWDAIRSRVHASSDDHVIKMTFTCAELAASGGNDGYRLAASRLVARGTS